MNGGLRSVRRNWERFGRRDPMFGVLAHPGMEGRWELDKFYQHGQREIDLLYEQIGETGVSLPTGRALDFGCGAGRLSFALARRFAAVDGVDISQPMLSFAERNRPLDAECRFHLYGGERLHFEDQSFDFAVSLMTLQHVPSVEVPHYISELVRVLRVGGVLAFQLPTGSRFPAPSVPAHVRVRQWVSHVAYHTVRRQPVMLMSGATPTEVQRMVLDAGGDEARAVPDGRAGDWGPSYLYVAIRAET